MSWSRTGEEAGVRVGVVGVDEAVALHLAGVLILGIRDGPVDPRLVGVEFRVDGFFGWYQILGPDEGCVEDVTELVR